MTVNTYPAADASLMLDLTRGRLATQMDSIDAIDAKTGTFLGWASGLIAIYVAFLALRFHVFGPIEIFLLGLNIGAYAAVAAMGLRSMRLHEWVTTPPLACLWSIYEEHDPNVLKWRVADDFYNYFEENQPEKIRKVSYHRMMRIGLIVQTVTVLLGIALS